MSLGVPLLGVDEVRELGRVPDEEDWGVVEDPVPVTFLRPQLDGETTGVTSGVGRSRLATDGGEADGGTNFLANTLEEGLRRDVAEVVGDLEVTMGSGTLGVDDTLWDTLTIEVSKEIDVMEVLEKKRAEGAGALSGIGLVDRGTVGGGVDGTVFCVENLCSGHVGGFRKEKGDKGESGGWGSILYILALAGIVRRASGHVRR